MAEPQPGDWLARALEQARVWGQTRSDDWWPDEGYVPYLEAEQQLYSWVLVKVGGIGPDEAMQRAVARFQYEPMDRRGIMTHDGAWRIAMGDLFGNHTRQPEEFGLAAEYEAEVRRLFHHDA